jgi:tRNA dimethylallyltransferase
MDKPKVLTIIGPTASGKTDLSYLLADEIKQRTGKDIEIISADSRQIYKHIPIATAQPSGEYLEKYKHHFINQFGLGDEFNAGTFGKMARELISFIFNRGKIPIVVGGSGLYLRSLIYGLFDIEDIIEEENGKEKQKEIRKELYKRLKSGGLKKLSDELLKIDPVTTAQMQNITERRVIRALEVYYLTGIPISTLRSRKVDIKFDFVQIGINRDRQVLYDKINKRVDKMIELGLIDEVKNLKKKGYDYGKYNSLNTVGVKEVLDHLEGKIDYERMRELIKQNTRRYAKRQLTWFKKDKNIMWVNFDLYHLWIEKIL